MSEIISFKTKTRVYAQDMMPGAYTVTNSITATSTPEDFEKICAENPEYHPSFGGRCGWTAVHTAAHKGNAKLLSHILKKYGFDLANVSREGGIVPLIDLVNAEGLSKDNVLQCAQILKDAGADPLISDMDGTNVLDYCMEKIKKNKHTLILSLFDE